MQCFVLDRWLCCQEITDGLSSHLAACHIGIGACDQIGMLIGSADRHSRVLWGLIEKAEAQAVHNSTSPI